MSFWSSLKDTAESIGGAIAAPYGAVYDLATAAFDDKDDNFGTIAAKVSGRAADLADPFFNEDTWSGAAIGGVMQALDTAYREGVSEPLSTAATMWGGLKYANRDSALGTEGWGDLFDKERWAEAYEIAQHRSIGQSLVVADKADGGEEGPVVDPFDERAYKQINKASPFLTSVQSGAVDFAARWYLDPGNVIGKGVKVTNEAVKYRKLTAEDKVDIAEKMTRAEAKKLGVPSFVHDQRDIATRTQKYIEWTDVMEASTIFHGSA